MAALAIIPIVPSELDADNLRTDPGVTEDQGATIVPLTSTYTEQSQRGSNPCLHLERVVS